MLYQQYFTVQLEHQLNMDTCIAYKDIKDVQFYFEKVYERPYTCVPCINV